MSKRLSHRWLTLNSQLKANVTKHLVSADLDPEMTRCPFCDCDVSNCFRVMQLQDEPSLFRMKCRSCGCTFVNRMPTDDYLTNYYMNYYDGDARRTHINTSRLSRRLLTAVSSMRRDCFRVLDFGGGDGGVALDLIQTAWIQSSYLAVVDFNKVRHPSPPAGVVIEHFAELKETLALPQFDLVIASAVLEHVKPLREILSALLDCLAPGGTFYARTPYTVPLNHLMSWFGVEFDTNFPAHLYDLGPQFWNHCIQTMNLGSGFSLTASRPSLVETEWHTAPVATLSATMFKLPWYLVGSSYPLVGGWEVLIRRE